jgi:hypothetical protein
VFAVLAGITTWPRLAHLTTSVVDHGDPLEDIWTLQWIGRALLTDPARLYDAPIFHGFPRPLAYDDIGVGQALVALPLAALTGNIVPAYNLLIVGSFALAGWCAFLLARHVTGNALAGLIAGTVYAFWSYTFAHLSHMSVLSLYAIPLALLCLHQVFAAAEDARAGRGRARAALLWAGAFALCFLWQTLHSFYYAAYLALAAGGLTAWEVAVTRRWRRWPGPLRWQVGAALGGAWLVVGVAVVLLSAPYREVQDELGFRRTAEEQTAWAARPSDYLGVSPRNRTYRFVLPNVWPEPLFPGFASLALGGAGLAALVLVAARGGRRDSAPADGAARTGAPAALGFYALLAGGAWVLSLGPVLDLGTIQVPLPYQILGALPGFNGLRAPVRLAALAALAWGILAGWGLRFWILDFGFWILAPRWKIYASKIQNPKSKIIMVGVTLLLMAVMVAEQWTVLTPTTPLPQGGALPAAYQWLADHPDGGVLAELPMAVGLRDPARTTLRMFYQGRHHHPLVNGYSSFIPPTYIELAQALDEDVLFTAQDVGLLQSLGVRYLLFERHAYQRSHWGRMMDQMPQFAPMTLAQHFGDEYYGHALFTVAPLAASDYLRLEVDLPERVAPGATIPLTLTVTNGYAYPLLTRLQPQLALDLQWEPPAGGAAAPPLRRQVAVPLVLAPGPATFRLDLPTPAPSGQYRLRVQPVRPAPPYQVGSPPAVTVGP